MKRLTCIIMILLLFACHSFSLAETSSDSPFPQFPEITWGMSPEQVLANDSEYAVDDNVDGFCSLTKPFLLDGMVSYVTYTFEEGALKFAFLAFYPQLPTRNDYKPAYENLCSKAKDEWGRTILLGSDDWENEDVRLMIYDEKAFSTISVIFGGDFGIGFSILRFISETES